MDTIFSLEGKVALVTGASSGLGVQFAKALARQGASVALLARRKDRLDQVAAEIRAMGAQCHYYIADVTREDQVIGAVKDAIKQFGRIDILVNNAGRTKGAPPEQMSLADWNSVIDINLTGIFLVAREVGKQMIRQRSGKIINISSMFGLVGHEVFPMANYCASKGGIIALTRQLAAEWAKHNINVNSLAPGYFESEMNASAMKSQEFLKRVEIGCPMKRMGKPGELDGAVVFLASDAASYVTGHVLYVDGGWTAV